MSHTADHAPSQPDGEGVTSTGFKLVYTVRESADVLCLGYSTVRERIASGELRSFKDGSRRLVGGEDLLADVKARQDAAWCRNAHPAIGWCSRIGRANGSP